MQHIFPMPTGGYEYAGFLFDTYYDALCAHIEGFFGETPEEIAEALNTRLDNAAYIEMMRDEEWLDDKATDEDLSRALYELREVVDTVE